MYRLISVKQKNPFFIKVFIQSFYVVFLVFIYSAYYFYIFTAKYTLIIIINTA